MRGRAGGNQVRQRAGVEGVRLHLHRRPSRLPSRHGVQLYCEFARVDYYGVFTAHLMQP